MNFSYWEKQTWFSNIDYVVIGAGIVGLFTALRLHELYPLSKIIILEKGILPNGASTKNAGFACFGSLTEIIDDLNNHTKQEVVQLVEKRWNGLRLLRKTLGDKAIDFKPFGGFELFNSNQDFEQAFNRVEEVNSLLEPIFKDNVFSKVKNTFGYQKTSNSLVFNKFEGQIDTGKMMQNLLQLVQSKGILILNNVEVTNLVNDNSVKVEINNSFTFNANKVAIATNGFAKQFLTEDIEPARAQVLITEPIKNLHIKGTFHLDKGYYYFRNINNRILFGGGRNLDFNTENTTTFGETKIIQQKLETILAETILPNTNFKIAHRWSGIMGIGNQKKAIVKQLNKNVYCGVRLGGMGIAIGSLIGQELANLIEN